MEKTYTTNEILIKLSEIILYQKTRDSDMIQLTKEIGIENFLKMSKIFENKTKRFKSFEDIQDSLYISTIFYYRELYINPDTGKKGLSYKQIQERIGKDVDVLKYRGKISKLSEYISTLVVDFLKDVRVKDGN